MLGDAKRRERYDKFGDDEEGDDFTSQEWLNAYEYYRAMHPEITKHDVRSFADRYRHSKDEEEDLIGYYQEHSGDITHILEEIICSENGDIERFVAFFDGQIKEGILKKTKRFEQSRGAVKLLPDEKAEAKKEKKKLQEESEKKVAAKKGGAGSMADLEKMILAKKENNFNGFLSYMEAKYGGDEGQDDSPKGKKRVKKGGNGKVAESPQKRKKTK